MQNWITFTLISFIFSFPDKPTNISFTSNRNRNIAMIDEGITLTCFADGNPKPRYRIIFNGALVRDAENGIVTILRANSSDEGTYHCLASNSEGELSAKINMAARFNMTARLNVTESDDINPSTNMFGTRLVQATTGKEYFLASICSST